MEYRFSDGEIKTKGIKARLLGRLHGAFLKEERQGLLLACKVRSIALLVIVAWQCLQNFTASAAFLFEIGEIGALLILGLLQYYLLISKRYPGWATFIFIAADCLVLSVMFIADNPFETGFDLPAAISLRGSWFVWYFMFLMQAAFSLRPGVVIWCGLSIVVARLGSLLWVLSVPGTFYEVESVPVTIENLMNIYFDPNFVSMEDRFAEVLAVMLVAIGLAIVASRTRRFAEDRVQAERSRSNLARYFSPNMADEISLSGGLDKTPRDQDVAVLFVDIVGFTAICENEKAENVVALLRDYHSLLADSVFLHGGTLDKYMGDGLMATFGTPRKGPHDATDALRCALDMVDKLRDWNLRRIGAGATPVTVGIGLHYGVAVVGDIGDERHVEFAVIGDTVNVASRVEHLTRRLNTPLTVSEDLANAVRREDNQGATLIDELIYAGPQVIRGREKQIGIWMMRPRAA